MLRFSVAARPSRKVAGGGWRQLSVDCDGTGTYFHKHLHLHSALCTSKFRVIAGNCNKIKKKKNLMVKLKSKLHSETRTAVGIGAHNSEKKYP